VLFCQNAGRRHKGGLTMVDVDGSRCNGGNDCFTRADVSLDQPVHRVTRRKVSAYFANYFLLGVGQRERQRFKQVGNLIIRNGINLGCVLLPVLFLLLNSKLEKKDLIKRQSVSSCAQQIEIIRIMNLMQSHRQVYQTRGLLDCRRQVIFNFCDMETNHAIDRGTHIFLSQPSCERINGDDTVGIQMGLIKAFKSWVIHLLSAQVHGDFS